jgi:myo-inositol-1(or 4)-monophosphatase
MIETNPVVTVAREAAKEAGLFLKSHFGKIGQIFVKGDRTLATDLDKAAEAMIVKRITAAFPDHNILGEEEEYAQKDSEYLWIIDPLDGTHNFIRGINTYGVSIGLWKKDSFIAGVVYMPETDEMYYAFEGQGAFKNGKRISVSKVEVMKDASVSFDSSIRYDTATMLPTLGEIATKCFNVRMTGSSVRQLTYVAEGVLDFAVEFYDKPWDFAGSVCLITEAGGHLTSLDDDIAGPETTGYVASNNTLHAEVLAIVNHHRKQQVM